jgi:hypothetical protein
MISLRSVVPIAAVITVAGGVPRAQTHAPSVKSLGNAIREYRDNRVHAVIAYEYSHRYHDGPWLLVDAALTTADRLTFHRADFKLMRPNETTVPLASESRFIANAAHINVVRQNARIWDRSLRPYFETRDGDTFRFFALPGEGVVTDSMVTDMYSPSFVTLFFESAEGRWPEGTFRLIIDNGRAHAAAIPIDLK